MSKAELKLELPVEEIEFLEAYANQHRTPVSDVVAGLVKGLHRPPRREIHPEVQKITGIIPPEVDVKEAHLQHILEKHK